MSTNRNQYGNRVQTSMPAYRHTQDNSMGRGCGNQPQPRAIDKCARVNPNTRQDHCMDQFPIGMAYVPWQTFRDLYDPHQGLHRGTLFCELDYPFYGKRGKC